MFDHDTLTTITTNIIIGIIIIMQICLFSFLGTYGIVTGFFRGLSAVGLK